MQDKRVQTTSQHLSIGKMANIDEYILDTETRENIVNTDAWLIWFLVYSITAEITEVIN